VSAQRVVLQQLMDFLVQQGRITPQARTAARWRSVPTAGAPIPG
jgi:hypothetical protein